MIFGTLRFLIWLAGFSVIVYFGLGLAGYSVNLNYFSENRAKCEEALKQCRSDLIQHGLQGAKERCDFKCVDPKLLIKKNDPTPDVSDTPDNEENQ